jgi:hypothetical protein
MEYKQYNTDETTENSQKDLGLEIDKAHNAKIDELVVSEGRDPSLLPDRIYRAEEDYPSKAFCFTGNGLYFSGTLCWSGYLESWGVCHLSYPGWAPDNFVGKGVKAAMEFIKREIEKDPSLTQKRNLCFYGTIDENGEFAG